MTRPRLPAAALAALLAAPLAAEPAFDLLPLGTFGGGYEANLSCYAVRRPGAPRYRVLLDAGSLSGAARIGAPPGDSTAGLTRGFDRIERFFLGLDRVFLTHAHLDHSSGLIIQSPSLFAADRPPLRVAGPAHAMTALKTHVFNGVVWGDMVAAKKMTLEPLAPGEPVAAGGFAVRPFAIDHTVPAFGYALAAPGGETFLHLGDTGPTRSYLPEARRLLAAGKLRALALECSFVSKKEMLAIQTGHLTPKLLVEHLRELVSPDRAGAGPLTDADLAAIAAGLRGVRVLVHHLKPGDAAGIRREVAAYRAKGLPLALPRQGQRLLF